MVRRWLLPAGIVVATGMLGACDLSPSPGPQDPSRVANTTAIQPKNSPVADPRKDCVVNNVAEYVSTALCSGDTETIEKALAKLQSESLIFPDAESAIQELSRRVMVIRRIWQNDRSVGQHLPWPQLNGEALRAILAIELAPIAFGTGDKELVDQIRSFARAFGPGDLRNGSQTGIRLVGASKLPGMEPWLYDIATSARADRLQKSAAYTALASYCSADALKFILAAQTDSQFPSELKYLIDHALGIRNSNSAACERIRGFGFSM